MQAVFEGGELPCMQYGVSISHLFFYTSSPLSSAFGKFSQALEVLLDILAMFWYS